MVQRIAPAQELRELTALRGCCLLVGLAPAERLFELHREGERVALRNRKAVSRLQVLAGG